MEYTIEKNVPIPAQGKYPWHKLEISKLVDGRLIGDSFFVPGAKITTMAAVASQSGRRYNMKFTCRTVDGGVRVWRIA